MLLGSFRNRMNFDAKQGELVQLMQKFVPRSYVGIFRNERTQSTPFDVDINTNDTSTPTPAPLGPINRARARQLNHQVSSFLTSCSPDLDNGDTCTLVLLGNNGVDQKWRGNSRVGFGLLDSSDL
jgi:hypothetical protein